MYLRGVSPVGAEAGGFSDIGTLGRTIGTVLTAKAGRRADVDRTD